MLVFLTDAFAYGQATPPHNETANDDGSTASGVKELPVIDELLTAANWKPSLVFVTALLVIAMFVYGLAPSVLNKLTATPPCTALVNLLASIVAPRIGPPEVKLSA